MTGHLKFAITPARTSGPASVTLVMPHNGYKAVASVTNPCGKPIAGASVKTHGNVATPHYGTYTGTAFVDWRITASHPTPGNAKVSMILASNQTIGRTTTCAGASPYGQHASALVTHPAASSSPLPIVGGLGVAVVLAALTAMWRHRRRRHRLEMAHLDDVIATHTRGYMGSHR